MIIDTGGRKGRALLMLLVCAAAALPFLAVKFAPVTDLPQQVSQLRLLAEASGDPASPYTVEWLAPNHLSYALLGLCWALFSPLAVGRIALCLTAFIFFAGVHHLAMIRNRPVSSAILSSAFFFGPSLYWGFYGFLLGFPMFLFFVSEVAGEDFEKRPFGEKTALGFALWGLLLFSHSLWFAAGLLWFGLRLIFFREKRRFALPLAIGILPFALFAGYWYLKLRDSGFESPSKMAVMPWERLAPSWFAEWSLGGLEGWFEPVFLVLVLIWIIAGLWQARGEIRKRVDPELLLPAGLFLLAALLLPYVSSNTTLFAQRWLSPALVLLLLGLPAPSIKPLAGTALALAAFASLALFTTIAWKEVEKNEYSGLEEVLAALPDNSSVLGLDYLQQSKYLKTQRPFLQTFAYAQAVKGATLSFSFADYANSLVYYSPKRERPWTRQLTWFPQNLKTGDLKYFTHVIAGGTEETHASLRKTGYFEPVTDSGAWRLYRSKLWGSSGEKGE
ncbi:hypothetical protein EPN96_00810 [bacterium]|nr:MAG: hypothetical protein EPN96_00810 [bacterium]